MRPRLHVHQIELARPSSAARAAMRPCLDRMARARPVVLALVSHGVGPGLSVAPWTLDGCVASLVEAGWKRSDLRYELVGAAPATRELRAWLVEHGIAPSADEGSLALAMPGSGGWVRLPRSWIGSNLCLVAPMVHGAHRHARQTGPLSRALDGLATTWGASRRVEVGARAVGEAFASAVGIADGSWWAELDDGGHPKWLIALDRVASTHELAEAGVAETIDAWIGSRLGLGPAPTGETRPVTLGDGTGGWPRIPVTKLGAPEGLAGRALGALWRPAVPTRRDGAAALPPPVPGPLGRRWHRYQGSTTESA